MRGGAEPLPKISLDEYAHLGPLDALIAHAEAEYAVEEPVELADPVDRIWTPQGWELRRSPGASAARAYARELVYGPDPEEELPRAERTERWERRRELGTMPERILQRETRMTGHGGGGRDSTGRAKDRGRRERQPVPPDLPVVGWKPGPQLAIWVTRGTGEYFQRATLNEAARAVEAHVAQLTAARGYPDRPLPKRNRRARLLVIRGCESATATIAKLKRGETSEALFEWALAHAATLVRSLDGIGGG
jgi:hypothetical protein